MGCLGKESVERGEGVATCTRPDALNTEKKPSLTRTRTQKLPRISDHSATANACL